MIEQFQSSPIKLSIVFLNYNRLAETRYTLSHLKRLTEHRQDIEIIAVDNGSSDGTSQFLQSQNDWIIAITLPTNIGIAGYNVGFRQTRGDYLLVLDDDSHPIDEVVFDRVIHCLETQPTIGIVACRIESIDNIPVYTWHLPDNDEAGHSIAFVGCGFAIRRDLFEKVGWYPEEFFLYQNEIEVAIRVMSEHYTIHYDPACRVVHRQSPQGRLNWRRVYYPTRNTIWIIRRYFPFPVASYLIASRLCFGFIRALQSGEFSWYYKAVKEAFNRPIQPQTLSPAMRKQLTRFWRENSVWHQLIAKL